MKKHILIKAHFYFEDVSNSYQKKIEGEPLNMCNLCYDGFEIFEDVKKHTPHCSCLLSAIKHYKTDKQMPT